MAVSPIKTQEQIKQEHELLLEKKIKESVKMQLVALLEIFDYDKKELQNFAEKEDLDLSNRASQVDILKIILSKKIENL